MKAKPGSKAIRKAHAAHPAPKHPHGVAIIASQDEVGEAPDQPFAEGATDELDPDLRHRLISEAAFNRQTERGYNSDYETDDWLEAETAIDHVIVNPNSDAKGRGST
jgi:hypothetical protein